MAGVEDALTLLQLSLRALWQPVTFGVRAFVEDRDGRVVLVRHSYRSGWYLPGGGVSRGELPERAVEREAREEAGVIKSAAPEFFGLYAQKVLWVDNVVAVYRMRDAEVDFQRSLEIRELVWADPRVPPRGTSNGTCRRLAEFIGTRTISSRW